ncbi:catalase-related domain-containing protein [Saccharopolyspora sp. CA-218241]|uniref:catalase-related domain-containing protein n=1 Tax=Saccharopolyspora sp. CA-218241 TaxID=3240027 RepID=UPI003D963B39
MTPDDQHSIHVEHGSRSIREPSQAVGAVADRFNFREDDDNYFEQPDNLFRGMSTEQQQVLFENTARAIDGPSEATIERHIHNCTQADPAYGAVRKAIEALAAGQLRGPPNAAPQASPCERLPGVVRDQVHHAGDSQLIRRTHP